MPELIVNESTCYDCRLPTRDCECLCANPRRHRREAAN
jgi:hypothetical protein